MYGETKDKILKRELGTVKVSESIQEKLPDVVDDRVTEVKPTDSKYIGKGGIRVQ